MKRCIIFARVSTGKQSTDSQVNTLKRYAIENGYTFTDEDIFEEKVSGVKVDVNRKILNSAIERAINEKVDCLMVWELSRISRLLYTFVNVVKTLEENKINLFVYSSNLNLLNPDKSRNEDDYMMMSIFASISTKEAASIKSRSMRGLYDSAENGIFGGNCGYGYERVNKKVVINKEEAKIVKKIFELSLNGEGIKQISKYLNDNKIPTKYTKTHKDKVIKFKGFEVDCSTLQWSDGTVYSILRNILLKGERKINNQLYTFKELQIIDNDTWQKVNDNLKKNNTKNKQGKHIKQFYLLNNIPIVCGVCGRNFQKKRNLKNNTNIYKCYSIAFGKYKKIKNEFDVECDNTTVNMDRLNNAVWYYVRRSQTLQNMIQRNIKQSTITKEIEKINTKINELNARNKTIENNLQTLVEREIKGLPKNIVDRLMNPLLNEKKLLEDELKSLISRLGELEQFEKQQNNLSTILKTIKQDNYVMKEYIDSIVKSITVYPVKNKDFKILSPHAQDNLVYIELQLFASFETVKFILSQREFRYKSNQYKILPLIDKEFNIHTKLIKPSIDKLQPRIKDILYDVNRF